MARKNGAELLGTDFFESKMCLKLRRIKFSQNKKSIMATPLKTFTKRPCSKPFGPLILLLGASHLGNERLEIGEMPSPKGQI